MGKDYFELLAKYNKETNNKMNGIIKNLSEAEWNKEFSGFFKSIHELCSHLFITDHTWLSRFKSLNLKSLKGECFNKNYSFKETLFKNIDEYITRRVELDAIMVDFINELTIDDPGKILKWTDSRETAHEKSIGVCLLHLFNHETHHRAMISLYLEMIGKENDYSNLYPYG